MDVDLGRAKARRSDPETSAAAAASLSLDGISRLQAAVLRELAGGEALPDVEIAQRVSRRFPECAWSESGIRTRRKELVVLSKVRDSGRRHRLASGREAIMWELVPEEVAP